MNPNLDPLSNMASIKAALLVMSQVADEIVVPTDHENASYASTTSSSALLNLFSAFRSMALRKGSIEKSSCYQCYSSPTVPTKSKHVQECTVNSASVCKAEMEVDLENLNAALHELGMLSAVTESRKEYLREKAGRSATRQVLQSSSRRSSQEKVVDETASSLHVLQMNTDYMTDFQGTWNFGHQIPDIQDHSTRLVLGAKQDSACCLLTHGMRPRIHRWRLDFHKPYSVPCDAKVRRHGWFSRNQDSESSSKSSRDSGIGNRSNPGSPEKGASEQANGLVRSRSLDDIEAIQVPASPVEAVVPNIHYSLLQRSDIESMSQRMEHLHVN